MEENLLNEKIFDIKQMASIVAAVASITWFVHDIYGEIEYLRLEDQKDKIYREEQINRIDEELIEIKRDVEELQNTD